MKKILIALFPLIILLFDCSSGKYVAEFKKIKKGIDTLIVLPINVKISIIDNNANRISVKLSIK